MKEIKCIIARHQFTEISEGKASQGCGTKPATPSVSAIDDELFKTSLSAGLMKSAEATQPWSTIGVDLWIECGRWWLLRSQMELYTVTVPQQKVPLAAYTNLIKASWILVDIIACHPQVPFLKASTHSEVQRLSAELKNEFSKLSALQSILPDLSELEEQDLQIWETQTRGPLLRPHKNSRRPDEWTVDGGEQVLFQTFALCKLHILTESLPCILLFLVRGDGQSARLITQNQNGGIMMDISFQTPVQIMESDSSVSTKDVKITFKTLQDAQHLGCLVEATNFYYFGRRAKHTRLEDLKAYVLITAVKNQRTDVIGRLLQRTSPNENTFEGESDAGPVMVASMLALEPRLALESRVALESRLALKTSLASQPIAKQFMEISGSGLQESNISLFFWAVQSGLAPLVRVLLIEHPTINGEEWHGMTPLGFASACGFEPVVRVFIDSGTDVQATDSSGLTALHQACSRGHEGVAKLLLRSGAEVGRRSTNLDEFSALHIAVTNDHETVIHLLIDSGADIEARDYEGSTPLCEATKNCHETMIALLLEKGANVNQRDEYGKNTTHYALQSQMSESTVRAILAKEPGRKNDVRDDAALRREKVVLEWYGWSSKWTIFYLDSPNAVIEIPKDTPNDVKCAYNRMIRIARSYHGSLTRFEFTIIHNEDALDFSIEHDSLTGPGIKIGNRRETQIDGLDTSTGVELGGIVPSRIKTLYYLDQVLATYKVDNLA